MKYILLLFSVVACATAQDIILPPPGPMPKTPQEAASRDFSTSCTFPATAAACRSYNELVTSKDSELLRLLSVRDAYVCFREDADVFNVISINTPTVGEFKRLQQSTLYQGPSSFIAYQRFKNGQTDHFLLFLGKWTKFGPVGYPSFETVGKEGPSLEITESEISLFEEYKNVSGGKTTHTIRARRSTMKATETFQWDNPPPDPKSGPDRGELTYAGHCISFN